MVPQLEKLIRLGALSRFEQGLGQRLWPARSARCRTWPVVVGPSCALYANVLIDTCDTPLARLWRVAVNHFGYGPTPAALAEWLVSRGIQFCRQLHTEIAHEAVPRRELTCTLEQLGDAAWWAGRWALAGDEWDDITRIEPPPFALMCGRATCVEVTPDRNVESFAATAASYVWTKEARAFLGDGWRP